jgi:hypothetical protein
MANLVRNYSFEDDGFNTSSLKFPVSKWMTMGSNLGETSTLDPKLDGHAEYLAIGTVGSLDSVSQTFATVVGQKYTFQFSFRVMVHQETGSSPCGTAPPSWM